MKFFKTTRTKLVSEMQKIFKIHDGRKMIYLFPLR